MIIIGVDFHPEFQQIAVVDTEIRELQEERLKHPNAAGSFYWEVVSRWAQARAGMEASGRGRWFERLMGDRRQHSRICPLPREDLLGMSLDDKMALLELGPSRGCAKSSIDCRSVLLARSGQ
jgi:hypothetical protein